MEFYQVINDRRTVRELKTEPIPADYKYHDKTSSLLLGVVKPEDEVIQGAQKSFLKENIMTEPIINEIDVKSVLTKSNLLVCEYSVNPYVGCIHACKYCYASFMKHFTGHTEDWETFLDIKHWKTIKSPEKYKDKELFIGSVTDPYNPQEETYGRTRTLSEQLQGNSAKLSIATKSDLILRDLDLIRSFPNVRISWSINTLDENFRKDRDHAVSIKRRLAAMKTFYLAGVRTTCFISPIFPGITDIRAIIRQARQQCNLIWLENLNLRGGYKTVIMDYIQKNTRSFIPYTMKYTTAKTAAI